VIHKVKCKKGFTLVELIVVISILVILVVMLLPNVIGYINEAKKTSVMESAKQVYTVAQMTLADVGVENMNYVNNNSGYLTFTNVGLSESDMNSNANTMPKLLGVEITKCMSWDLQTKRCPFKNDAPAYGANVTDYQKQNNQPGIIIQYHPNGGIVYMEWGEDDYIVRINNKTGDIITEKNGAFSSQAELNS